MEIEFYKDLIDKLPMAYAYHKIICDKYGMPCDFEFLEINNTFEKITGLKAQNVLGKKVSEVIPKIKESQFNWIKAYGEVALKDLRTEFDEYLETLGKWYRVFAYSPKKDYFVALFLDITDIMKKTEEDEIIYTMLNDIVFELDEGYCFKNVLVNDETKLFIPKCEIIGKMIYDIFPEKLADSFINAFTKAKISGEREFISYPSIIPTEDKWFEAIIKYIKIKNKNRFIVSISEITEKKKLEQSLVKSEELFRTVFEQAPIGIAVGSSYKLISNINPMFEKITGRTKEELTSLDWTDITHPEDLKENLEYFTKFKDGVIDNFSMEKRYIKPDGSYVWVNMVIASLQLSNKSDCKYVCLVEDITERVQSEKALQESEQNNKVLLSNLPGMAYRCDYNSDYTIRVVSDGCYALTGYKPESLLYNKKLSFSELIQPEYKDMVWDEWCRVIDLKTTFKCEYEIKTASGEVKWVFEQGQGIYDKNGEVTALEGLIVDITEQKKRENEILYLNYHDTMTNLYNRAYFDIEKKRLDVESQIPLSIIIGDINGLKFINDAFGHAKGDNLIIETAKILRSCCREEDNLARTGGDEFSIILPKADRDTAFKILNKIKRACDEYNRNVSNEAYYISISLGYNTKTDINEDFEQVIKAAEDYMYKRKLLMHKSSHSAIISSIKTTMFERSQETEEHAERLIGLTKLVGIDLDLSQLELYELELLATLHDIGKVGIDNRILYKPDKLSESEWTDMKKHPEIGYRIAMASPDLVQIAEYIFCHHERWDGKGYPQGLKGEEIPLLSRILAVADSYDAMIQDRPYRKAMSKEAAIAEIKKNAGIQFDPKIASIFIEKIAGENL